MSMRVVGLNEVWWEAFTFLRGATADIVKTVIKLLLMQVVQAQYSEGTVRMLRGVGGKQACKVLG